MDHRHYSHKDATSHKRSPAEESFYESFLLQKESNIGNLYASNLYQVQCYSKTVKHLNKQRSVQAAEMDREMKKIQKKMDHLKTKSHNVHFLSEKCASSGCFRDSKSAYNSPSLPRLKSGFGGMPSPPITRAFSELGIGSQSARILSKSCSNLSSITNPCFNPKCAASVDGDKNNNDNTDRGMFITNAKALLDDNMEAMINPSNRLSVMGANVKHRNSKSHEDLKSLALLERRQRASTMTKLSVHDSKRGANELHMRYIPREDRVRSAFVLPKI